MTSATPSSPSANPSSPPPSATSEENVVAATHAPRRVFNRPNTELASLSDAWLLVENERAHARSVIAGEKRDVMKEFSNVQSSLMNITALTDELSSTLTLSVMAIQQFSERVQSMEYRTWRARWRRAKARIRLWWATHVVAPEDSL